ncbi:hypothetical protein ACE2AK_25155 [Rahnella perminowiae]|uniref:hypothetical protein n=1 Tax=Enterobacterales TaxID=91347 RepID=UPI00215D36FC|nr:hypothetical protein [Rahnella perminowiae]
MTGDKKYKTKVFSNTSKGFSELLNWLEPYRECHICLEATGAYSEPIATFLCDAGCSGQVILSTVLW